MRKRTVLGWVVTMGVLSACGDSTEPAQPTITGTWEAQTAVATNPADASEQVDLLATGLALRLEVASGGALTLTVTIGEGTDVQDGQITLDGDEVTLVLDGDTIQGSYTLTADLLTLDLRTGAVWDFGNDGMDEPAYLFLTFTRAE